jgi:acyl carrier protein
MTGISPSHITIGVLNMMIPKERLAQTKSIKEVLDEIRPEIDFTSSQDFIGDGILDSYDVVTLVADLDDAYGISISGLDIVPENFQSIAAIQELLQKYGKP